MVDQKFLDEMNLIISTLLRTYTSGEFTITDDMIREHIDKNNSVTIERVFDGFNLGYKLKLGDQK